MYGGKRKQVLNLIESDYREPVYSNKRRERWSRILLLQAEVVVLVNSFQTDECSTCGRHKDCKYNYLRIIFGAGITWDYLNRSRGGKGFYYYYYYFYFYGPVVWQFHTTTTTTYLGYNVPQFIHLLRPGLFVFVCLFLHEDNTSGEWSTEVLVTKLSLPAAVFPRVCS